MVVDGEIVAFDGAQTRFERLQQRLGVVDPSQQLLDDFPVYYYLFDVLYADGRDTRALLSRRKAGYIASGRPIRRSDSGILRPRWRSVVSFQWSECVCVSKTA